MPEVSPALYSDECENDRFSGARQIGGGRAILLDSKWESDTAVTSGLAGAPERAAGPREAEAQNELQQALAAQIGEKYEVLHKIGGGGMAEVFLARHRKHGGLAAVKALSPRLSVDPQVVARFVQEARTAAKLSGHSNIVSIFDVGEGGGLYYIIMQYVAGEDLDQRLARAGKLPPASVIEVIRSVAEALAAAASSGIVHRDIKPGNIRIDPDGRVIVLDFGIAKARDVPGPLTLDGDRLGTPYYMSPEQIRGAACDQRSDIYSLGIVFYELLTGVRPFRGENYRAIQDAHLHQDVRMPAEVDAECSRIVARMTAKHPAARYQTAAELLEDLGAASTRPIAPPRLKFLTALGRVSIVAKMRAKAQRAHRATWVIALALALSGGLAIYMAAGRRQHSDKVQTPVTAQAIVRPGNTSALPRMLQDPNGDMVLVPAGEFIFGDNAPESPNPRQQVNLGAFYIDRTEVPNSVYRGFCEATGHAPPDSADFRTRPEFPVVNVTADDAQAFAAWAGKRIPTEQEWEKAARGVDGRVYPWGGHSTPAPAMIQPVDSLPDRQSPYGVLHMAGNVWEWTVTLYPETEKQIQEARDVARGRAMSPQWFSIKGGKFPADAFDFYRLFMRRGFPRDWRSDWIGFRCIKYA